VEVIKFNLASLFLVLIALMGDPITILGQESFIVNRKRITKEQGLLSNNVLALQQDPLGIYWIATDLGLQTYDGFRMKTIVHDKLPANTSVIALGILGNYLFYLQGLDNYFLESNARLYLLDWRTMEHLDPADVLGKSFERLSVHNLHHYGPDKIHLHCDNLKVYQINDQLEIQQLSNLEDKKLPLNSGYYYKDLSLYRADSSAQADSIIVCYKSGINCKSFHKTTLQGGKNHSIFYFKDRNPQLTNPPARLCTYPERITEKDIGEISHALCMGNEFIHDLHTRTSYLYSQKSLYQIKGDKLHKLLDNADYSLKENDITKIFLDKWGNHILILNGRGLLLIKSNKRQFTPLHYEQQDLEDIPTSKQTRAIHYDGKELLTFQWKNMLISDLEGKIIRQTFRKEGQTLLDFFRLGDRSFMGHHELYELNTKTLQTKTLLSLEDHIIWDINALNDTTLLLAGTKFLMTYDLKEEGKIQILYENTSRGPITGMIYKTLVQGDSIWLASDQGLFSIPFHAKYPLVLTPHIQGQVIYDLHMDTQGILWLATKKEGLQGYDPQKRELLPSPQDKKFSIKTIFSILPDHKGNLWLGTEAGLLRYNKEEGRLALFDMDQGLPFDEFNRLSTFNYKDSILFMGGRNGLIWFFPDSIQAMLSNQTDHPIHLRAARARQFGQTDFETLLHPTSDQVSLVMGSEYEELVLDFFSENYLFNPVSFEYRMQPNDPWIPLPHPQIVLKKPDYGRYALEIRGFDKAGNLLPTKLSMSLLVDKPWYLKWYALTMGALLFFLGISLFLKIRTQYLQREQERLNDLIESKTRELQSSLKNKEVLLSELAHRVKNNLTLISSLLELQKNASQNEAVINILESNQKRLRSMSLVHDNLNVDQKLDSVNFNTYLRQLITEFNQMISGKSISIELNVYRHNLTLETGRALNLSLILNEWLTNSIKHSKIDGKPLKILVFVEIIEGKTFHLQYEDTGKIFKFNQVKDSSLGLTIVNLLAKQVNAKLTFGNEWGNRYDLYFDL
jgi:two-component sensor histidine kinase